MSVTVILPSFLLPPFAFPKSESCALPTNPVASSRIKNKASSHDTFVPTCSKLEWKLLSIIQPIAEKTWGVTSFPCLSSMSIVSRRGLREHRLPITLTNPNTNRSTCSSTVFTFPVLQPIAKHLSASCSFVHFCLNIYWKLAGHLGNSCAEYSLNRKKLKHLHIQHHPPPHMQINKLDSQLPQHMY